MSQVWFGRFLLPCACALALWGALGLAPAFGQAGAAAEPDSEVASVDAGNQARRLITTSDVGPFRKISPRAEIVVAPDLEGDDTFSRHDVVGLLAIDAQFGQRAFSTGREFAKDVVFQRDVWGLEFTFKPVRFIEVDLPSEEGRFERTLVWYLAFHVQNNGQVLKRTVGDDGIAQDKLVGTAEPVRFVPEFTLESWDTGKRYQDQLIPLAVKAVQLREDPNRTFLDTVQISGDLPASTEDEDKSVWGVATWIGIDPATDHFSIYVKGLTNAYRWSDVAPGQLGAFKEGESVLTGRTFQEKTLRLNFWRPSDAFDEHEDEIRFGYWKHPGHERFNVPPAERVDYAWVYR